MRMLIYDPKLWKNVTFESYVIVTFKTPHCAHFKGTQLSEVKRTLFRIENDVP